MNETSDAWPGPDSKPDKTMTTSTLRASEGFRLSYRRTTRRLIGLPMMVESDAYELPLLLEAVDQLSGFHKACLDSLYTVVPIDDHGTRRLRAWAPRIRITFKRPVEPEQYARLARATEELRALGYTVVHEDTSNMVALFASRPTTGDAA